MREALPRRAGRSTPLGGLLLLSLLLPGCRGESGPPSAFDFDLSVSPTPPAVGPARLTLTITDPEGSPVPDLTVRVEGTMTHPGMVPVLAEALESADGRYVVEAFDFSMAGDWILIVSGSHPDGREGHREFPLRAVAPFPSGP